MFKKIIFAQLTGVTCPTEMTFCVAFCTLRLIAANEAAVVFKTALVEVPDGFTTKLLPPTAIAFAEVNTKLPVSMNKRKLRSHDQCF